MYIYIVIQWTLFWTKQLWSKCCCFGILLIYNSNIFYLLLAFYGVVENRQRGRFAGFSLYVSNTGDIKGSTLCYKDGPQLPPLNFSTTCTEYGRYVIFYNERKDGVLYPAQYQLNNVNTELCEVIVKGILYIFYHKSFLLQLHVFLQFILLLTNYRTDTDDNHVIKIMHNLL